ncbi:exo-beta-N-acetylmuramidase NamZ domain-containing protein [Streptomyces sp. NPDC090025]|uniref:exo-beta-N-acetylmuramidase NamZ family protein n=1 Tax=Streptomyces sp. NPDC090025 TaxID=3365922 RepID=UPI00383944A3
MNDSGRLSRRGLLGAGGALVSGAAVAGATAPAAVAAVAHGPGHRVRTGFERLAADGYAALSGRRVGVVTNPTGITADARHIVDVMHADERVELAAVFGPEHGFRGTAQAGGSEGRYDDPATGLPVHDTYLKSGQALADVFTASGVDTVVFDIQDVGARFYTYIWTLYDCMAAAALAGKRFMVLDRPNPVTGRAALGPVLDRAFATFVGREPIAQAHGMTVAELARLFEGEFLAKGGARTGAGAGARAGAGAGVAAGRGGRLQLETVTMSGWRRGDFFDATGLPWVPPSPNMPTADTALVYAGTCLFEGTNLSEGRGTTRPFELLGAEGIDGRWAAAVNALGLPGVRFREAYFAPTFSKFQGKTVGGVQLMVHDRAAFDPVRTGIALLVTARRVWSGFAWRPDLWIDKLTGSARVRTLIDAGADVDEVTGAWATDLAAFRTLRRGYLLYR